MDWEVTVITDSNYIKKVRVNDCISRQEAEAQALGTTGAKKVIVSNPKTYKKVDNNEYKSYNVDSVDSDEGMGYLILGALILIYMYWKFFLVIGVISLIVWLIIKSIIYEMNK